MTVDPVLKRIGDAAQMNHHQSQRDAARELLAQIWEEIGGEQGDPLHVCVLAHAVADVQDDVGEGSIWDLWALAVADLIADERLAQVERSSGSASTFGTLKLGSRHWVTTNTVSSSRALWSD